MTSKYLYHFFCFILISFFIANTSVSAQQLTELWNGLRTAQPSETMPKGNAPYQTSQRILKKNIPTKLISTQEGEWIISDGWEMAESDKVITAQQSIFSNDFNTSDWYNATVPGTVLTTLVNQGVYPDPFYGLNNLAIPDSLCRMSWWYRTSFSPPENKWGKQVYLLFNGINYQAEVFFNGKKLGNIDGAFIRGKFNITSLVRKDQKNVLAVYIHPPLNPGIPSEQSMVYGQGLNGGNLSQDGPTFISSIGWDWIPGIRDRNMGIWQDVRLKMEGDVTIGDPLIETNLSLPDTTHAEVNIRVPLKNTSNKEVQGNLSTQFEGVAVLTPYTLLAHEEKVLTIIQTVKNPKLWWPNGYGAQNLYHLELQATEGTTVSDLKKIRFGIRKLSYELMINTPSKGNHRICYSPLDMNNGKKPIFDFIHRTVYDSVKHISLPTLWKGTDETRFQELSNDDPVGPYLVIRVNGKRIFCRGGNWGMDDGMKRCTRERLEPYMKLHQEANFNIVRNWTGESTDKTFYDLCDEYGMLVWNDFWITTDDTSDPNDQALFMKNATDVVRRYRNHPSIVIWNPRNEGYAPEGLALPLEEMMAKEDPTRHYHGQSRFLNMGTSGPWNYFDNPSLYYTHNAEGFDTEMGSFAVPTAHTIRKFIAPEDQWPINDVWAYHDLHHTSQNFKGFMAAIDHYGKPTGLDDFAKKAQMVTYDAWRNMLEAWNSKMWNNTTGLILWMTHPAWPSMIWQTYSYDYETPGSYFGAKKACEPIHIQMNLPDHKIVILNTTLQDQKQMLVAVDYYNTKGELLFHQSEKYTAISNAVTPCFIPKVNHLPSLYLVRLTLKNSLGKVVSMNDYWKTANPASFDQLNDLGMAKLKIVKTKKGIEVTNTSKVMAIAVKFNVRNSNDELILPAYFSDGYINLLPREKRIINLEQTSNVPEDYKISTEGYNLN